jgi:hypothetical protein
LHQQRRGRRRHAENGLSHAVGKRGRGETFRVGATVLRRNGRCCFKLADGAGDGVGLGASVGINLVDEKSSATVARSLTLSGTLNVLAISNTLSSIDAKASAKFEADVNHQGRFKVPVLTTHGIGDSTVFVEGSDTLRQRMEASGNGARLVQTYVNSSEHSYLGDPIYPPLFEALLAWVNQGTKPTPAGIAARCAALRPAQVAECRFDTAYTPRPLASRIAPR